MRNHAPPPCPIAVPTGCGTAARPARVLSARPIGDAPKWCLVGLAVA
jgi:hypothetical protein